MDAVLFLWSLTLVLALLVTVPVLAVIVRLIHHLMEIDRLARVTLEAAGGVARNTTTIAALPVLLEHATSLAGSAQAVDGIAARIHGHGAAVVRTLLQRPR